MPMSVSPQAGAVGPDAFLSRLSKASFTDSGVRLPFPTSMSVPAMWIHCPDPKDPLH